MNLDRLATGMLVALSILAVAASPPDEPGGRPKNEPRQGEPTPTPEVPLQPPSPTYKILEGQVTDSIGAGHIGVSITVRRKTDDGRPGELIADTVTEKLGDFVIESPQPIRGEVVVTFAVTGYIDLVRELRLGDEEYPPYLAETLEGDLEVRGKVVDALKEAPVVGAAITLRVVYNEWKATTDSQGLFLIERVSPGSGELIVEAKGFGREKQGIALLIERVSPDSGELIVEDKDFGREKREIADVADGNDVIIVKVKPERILHIKVVDAQDSPIPGVTIETYDRANDDFRTLVTDRQGSGTIRGAQFDAGLIEVRLTHPEYVSSEGFDREIDPPEDKAESSHQFVMVRAGSVAGSITDRQTGGPVYGARVMTGETAFDRSPRDWSNYEGRFSIGGVKPGEAVVTVHMSGYAPTLRVCEAVAAETTRLEIQLGPPAMVNGIVRTKDGQPVPGAQIEATKWRGYATLGLRAMTDIQGRFVIPDAPQDEFEITVFAARTNPFTQTIKAGSADPIQITLPKASTGRATSPLASLKIGEAAPAVVLTSLDGESFELARLKGKTILLDFWATWCGPCVAEIPELRTVYRTFSQRKNFVMIGVSLDWDEKALKRFLKKHKIAWPQVFGDAGNAQKIADQFGVRGVPSTFIIGPDGNIAATDLPAAQIAKRLEQVLSGSDAAQP